MSEQRIIINIVDDTPNATALWAVMRVIKEGRISSSQHGPAYSLGAVFESSGKEVKVFSRRNKASDSFWVYTG